MTGWLLVIVPALAGSAATAQATSSGALAFAFPQMVARGTIASLVLGQDVAALAVDHAGLFGQPRGPVTEGRLAGSGSLVVGTLLMRWR